MACVRYAGICWIQTDDGAYTGTTNCMMLAAIPGNVGDGGTRQIVNTVGAATSTITTYVPLRPRKPICAASWSARRAARSQASQRHRI